VVVGSSTAFAGVFTYHADGFVVVFFFFCGFGVKAITAHYLSADAFETAFGFNLSAVGTGGFWGDKCGGGGDDGGNEFFVVFAFSFGEDCFNLDGGQTRVFTCGCDFCIEFASSLVVSLLVANGASHRNRNR